MDEQITNNSYISYFKELEQKLENEIKDIKKNITRPYDSSYIIKLSKEEIEKIFYSYGFDNYQEIAIKIIIYNQLINNEEKVKASFSKHITLLNESISTHIDELNSIINDRAKVEYDKIELLNQEIEKIKHVNSIIFSDKESLSEEEYEEIIDFISNLKISDDSKLLLIRNVAIHISEKQKSIVNHQEEALRTRIKSEAKEIYEEFFIKTNKLEEFKNIKDSEAAFTREEIEEYAEDGYELETFAHALLIEIQTIEQEQDIEKLKYSRDRLLELVRMYNKYIELKQDIEDIKNIMSDIYINGNTSIPAEELNKIYEFIYPIQELKIQSSYDFEDQIKNIKTKLGQTDSNGNTKIPIKSFVLFPYDDVTNEPYFVNDIINKKMIDDSTDAYSSGSYIKDIPEVFHEIITNGNVEYLESTNSSTQNFSEKIISQICHLDNKGRVNRNNKTDMWRIRPLRNSELRFAEKRIILKKDTPIYNQIINILKEYMKNISVNEDEDFTLSINYCIGLKKTDGDLYKAAISRRYGKNTEGNIINNILSKDELTDEELSYIDTVIKKSIETYNIIRGYDPNYDFSYIDRMVGGGNKHAK